MMKSKVLINKEYFHLESWVSYDSTRYVYVLAFQLFKSASKDKPIVERIRISKEFIEDEVVDSPSLDELGIINHRMLELHIDEIIQGSSNLFSIQRWLGEAKNIVKSEVKD